MISSVDSPETHELVAGLRRAGLVRSAAPRLTALTGGVSSEIFLVEDGADRFVVKRALARLRVRDEWFADLSRSRTEQAYLQRVGTFLPGSVPRIIAADPEGSWFAMEHLADGLANWKGELLAGRVVATHAQRAGERLGRIHRATWRDAGAAQEFATGRIFHQLRVEPYLETSARRVSDLAAPLRAEAARLSTTSLALVHGDFSPKNILVSAGRLVMLDAEAAWFGDPAFDPAFLLTHLYLKALRAPADRTALLGLPAVFWDAYAAALGGPQADGELEKRSVRLLLCLMLARIHGKSPVEYLPEPARQKCVVDFVRDHLPLPPSRLADLTEAWRRAIEPA